MMEIEKQLPFELIIGDETGEILNGDVPVRWCVSSELVKELEDSNIVDPHVLLVSVDNGREMQRQLLPITELMTFMRFTRAGDMKLYGFILNADAGRERLHNTYMRKQSGGYTTDIMFAYTDLPHDDLPNEFVRTEVTINIPDNVFGKEPSKWMKWYVNAWHYGSSAVVDECYYRRRMIIAFTLKVIPFLLWTMVLIAVRVAITGLLKLAGYFKCVDFFKSFRPYKWPSMDYHLVSDHEWRNNSLIVYRKFITNWNTKEEVMMFSTIPFIPLVLIVQAGIVWPFADYFVHSMLMTSAFVLLACVIIDTIFFILTWAISTPTLGNMVEKLDKKCGNIIDLGTKYNFGQIVLLLGLIVAFIIVYQFSTLFAMLGGVILVAMILGFVVYKYSDKLFEWLDNVYTISATKNDYKEIRELLCPLDEDNLRPNINFIPPKQRTIRLRYLDLKNKVCKPMQR